MSKYSKMGRVAKCGSPDSKYMSRPNGLDEDISAKESDAEKFKSDIRTLVLSEPSKIKLRYNNTIDIMLEIKREFNL